MDKELIKRHGFTDEEYQKILEILGREPNLLELGIFSTQWSEHCSYKSSRPKLKGLHTIGKYVLQGPGENAGVIELKKGYVVAFKVESHNHPSAVEPFHGAATGVGGIVRDILSMGVRPIALMDSLRFGELEDPHVKHLFDGVVGGISFYGNCIGVPCVAGDVYFDEPYKENCLVNACCTGIGKKDKLKKGIAQGVGNLLLLVGSKTGREGIHGATFASDVLEGSKEEKRPSVQIGDPFYEKLLIEAILEVVDFKELIGMQDLGAGGLSTTPGEMAARGGVGIEIDVEKIPVKSPTMTPYEIMLSETQERFLLCIKKGREEKFIKVFKKWGLEAEVIGKVIKEKVFRIKKGSEVLAEIPVDGLVDGVPIRNLPEKEPEYIEKLRSISLPSFKGSDIKGDFLKLLASPNIASKGWVYEQYDHTVRGDTILVPGKGDAAVLRIKGETFGIAITMDGNGRYCYLNPFEGGKIAVTEAARNLTAVGAEPMAITDCLNFGNPEDPEVFWTFSRVVDGLNEAAKRLDIPIISGNVSFYNETDKHRIYPTPVVGMIGMVEDLTKIVDMTVKSPGDFISVIGKQAGAIGGSEFLKVLHGIVGGELDEVDLEFEKELQATVLYLIRNGKLMAVHDVAEGGLLTALFEMYTNTKGFGVVADLPSLDEDFLFGEWQSRFLISYDAMHRHDIFKTLSERGIPYLEIGLVTEDETFVINCGEQSVEWNLEELRKVYSDSIRVLME